MLEPTILPVEDLLRDERWLRALAGRVVAGADVDDVVQDTMVAALGAPPRDRVRVRAWLGRVAHHFALRHKHGERRRAVRERGAARPEALPAVDATLERLALARRVTEAVVALPEPYRTTLLWHFHDEAPVRVIAQRLGTTEANVRKRIERGLAMVRARLAGELGGEWRPTLAPLAPGSVIAMKKVVATAVAVCLVVGTVVGFWPEPVAGPELQLPVSVAAVSASPADAGNTIASAVAPQPLARAPVTPTRGRILDIEGQPIPHVGFTIDGQPVRGDDEGRFALAAGVSFARLQCAGYYVLQAGAREVGGAREIALVLAAGTQIACDVRDDEGTPLGGVAIHWSARAPAMTELEPLPELVVLGDGVIEELRPAREGPSEAWSDSASPGSYSCMVPAIALELRFTKEGHVPHTVSLAEDGAVQAPAPASPWPGPLMLPGFSSILPVAKWPKAWRDDTCLHVTLDKVPLPACKITGRVRTARDAPVAGALVGFQQHLSTTTDADGRFALDLDPQHLPGKAPPLFAAKPGMCTALLLDVVERLRRSGDGAIEVELRLGDAPLVIRGRVRSERGEPRAGLLVFPWGTEDLGGELGTPEDLALPAGAPEMSAGIRGRRAIARTDAEGRFTLPGLLDRDYRLRVCDQSWLVLTTGVVRAGTEVDIVIAKSKCGLEVAGTARDRHGVPLADVQVMFACTKDQGGGGACGLMVELGRTDAQGRYAVQRVMREGRLHFRKEGCIDHRTDMAHWSGGTLDVVLAGACEFQLEGVLRWQTIELRDAQGRAVPIQGDNPNFDVGRDALEIGDDGRTKVAVASEEAVSIVLLREDGRWERRPIQLTPGRRNVIRL